MLELLHALISLLDVFLTIGKDLKIGSLSLFNRAFATRKQA